MKGIDQAWAAETSGGAARARKVGDALVDDDLVELGVIVEVMVDKVTEEEECVV